MEKKPQSQQVVSGDDASRPQYVAVVEQDCTGCQSCVDFCLVDCIEPASAAAGKLQSSPVHIRDEECIGCAICATVCEQIGVQAIHLVPIPKGR